VRHESATKFAQRAVEALLPWPLLSLAFGNTRGHPTRQGKRLLSTYRAIGIYRRWIALIMYPTYPRTHVHAHPLTFESWRLVHSPRSYAVRVTYLRYSSSIEKIVLSNALNVILSRQKTKRETIKGSCGIIFIRDFLNVPKRFVLTVTRHAVASCPNCPEVLERFVTYLERAESNREAIRNSL